MTKKETAIVKAGAKREDWGEQMMWMVIIGEMDADEATKGARIRPTAEPLRRLPIEKRPKIQVHWDLLVGARDNPLDGEKAPKFASCHSRSDWTPLYVPVDKLQTAFWRSAPKHRGDLRSRVSG